MRKIFALLALVLGVVSCQTEPEGFDATVGGEKEVNITVSLPEATRSNSALGAFDNVDFTKYDVRFQCEVHYKGEKKVLDAQYSDNGKSATFPVRLIANRDYKFVVWADLVDQVTHEDLHYNTAAGLSAITLNENTWVAMDETRDAYTCSEVRKFEGTGITLTLKRPFAKLRVKTTDMNELMGVVPTSAIVEYTTPHYAKFDAVEGNVVTTETTTKTHTYTIANYDDNSETTKILFTDYFFATAEQDVVKFDMTVKDKAGVEIGDTKHFNTAIPVQRNYLTTIAGNILTTGDNITVVIDDEFGGYYTVPSEVSELVNVIDSAADGVETIIPVNEDITLPEALTIPAGKNIVLDFAANTRLTGALVVEDGAELTINNGIIKNEDKSVSGITTNGNVTLNNVEIESARHAVRVESGEVVIYGGTFKVNPVSASTLHALNVGDDGKSATVIIKDGTFIGPKGTTADSGSAVNVRNGSTVIIEGGNFSGGKTKTLSAAAGATLIVKGGFFDQDPSAFVATDYTAIDMNTTRSAIEEYVYAVMKGEEVDNHYEILIEDKAALEFLAEVVDYKYTFAGDVVKLEGDINLFEADANGEAICFDPIGSYRFEKAFMGTFDGQNFTISGLNQNTWALNNGYYYNDCGLGLFGALQDAEVRNLKVDDAHISGESALCGIISAYAENTTFKNITVTNSDCADYQYYSGGIVGWVSGKNNNFINCNLDASTIVGGQWGDFSNSNGGIIGGASGSATILMKDCNVACRIDAVNDVVSTYHYYAYRCCGMLIGNTNKKQDIDGTPYAAAPQLTCENVTVTYGDWMNYHYCEFGDGKYAYVRAEAGVSVSGYVNIRYGHPTDANGNTVVDHNHAHNDGEDHHICLPFDQLLGGGPNGDGRNPVYGLASFPGVTVVYPAEYTCPVCGEQHNVK